MRAVAGRPVTLQLVVDDDYGQPIAADSPPTVTVTDGAGTPIVTAATSTAADQDGIYTYVLAARSQLDRLTATWSSLVGTHARTDVQLIDIIARRLVPPYELKQDDEISRLSNWQFLNLLDHVEELFRDACDYPQVLEGARITFDEQRYGITAPIVGPVPTLTGLPYGYAGGRLLLKGIREPVQIYAGSINGSALDPAADIPHIAVSNGVLIWDDYRAWPPGRYSFWLTHGEVAPPRDLVWAAQRTAKHFARTNNYPDRALTVSTEGSTITFGFPSKDNPTGIPDVDAILNRRRLESVI